MKISILLLCSSFFILLEFLKELNEEIMLILYFISLFLIYTSSRVFYSDTSEYLNIILILPFARFVWLFTKIKLSFYIVSIGQLIYHLLLNKILKKDFSNKK